MSTITLQTQDTEDSKISNTTLNRAIAEDFGWSPGQGCNGPYVDYSRYFQCIRCNATCNEKGQHEYHIPNYAGNLNFALAVTHRCATYTIEGAFPVDGFRGQPQRCLVTLESSSGKKVTVHSDTTLAHALCLAYYYLIQNHIPVDQREHEGLGILPIANQAKEEVAI